MLLHLVEYQLVSFALKYLNGTFEEVRLFLEVPGALLTASEKILIFLRKNLDN